MSDERSVVLPGSDWLVWRSAVLRAPGFEATGLDRLAAPVCAEAADALLGGRVDAAGFQQAFATATRAMSEAILGISRDPRFQEAVTWQSLTSVEAIDGLLRTDVDGPRNSRRRTREVAVTRYWQRYCGKNDTIGFFGPVCWARFEPAGPAVTAQPGPTLIRRRSVDLEWRVLTALAERIAADPRLRPWLLVVRRPELAVVGDQLLRVGSAPMTISPAVQALLAASDGTRTVADVCSAAVADPQSALRKESDADLVLSTLVEQGLVRCGWDLPYGSTAEGYLRARLAAVGDDAARLDALALLDRVGVARDALAAAVGDPTALRAALQEVERVVVDVTGAGARHRPGATYAGRSVAYEEADRDLVVAFGPAVLATLAPPLAPLLQAARWLTVAIADAYQAALRELYDEAVLATGASVVPLGELSYLANGVMFAERLAGTVMAEFSRRWAQALGLTEQVRSEPALTVDVAAFAAAVDTLFPATAAGWSTARLHSPDLQLAATGPDALNAGDFTAVLGELHTAWLTVDNDLFLRFHPDLPALRTELQRQVGSRIVLLYPPDYPEFTARLAPALAGPGDVFLAYADGPAVTLAGVLPLASLTAVLIDGELTVRSPDGRSWPVVEVFGPFLSAFAASAFKLSTDGGHTPRITVGPLVVQRETWRTTLGASGLIAGGNGPLDESRGYLDVRRWVRDLGLPERVFVKVGTEIKPCYVDFTSPAYVAAFIALIRAAHRTGGDDVPLGVSEMLPTSEQAWVPDAEGRRYLSELRLTIVDPAPAATGWTGDSDG